jgi:hypothetical protein
LEKVADSHKLELYHDVHPKSFSGYQQVPLQLQQNGYAYLVYLQKSILAKYCCNRSLMSGVNIKLFSLGASVSAALARERHSRYFHILHI